MTYNFSLAQDYDVSDIQCSVATPESSGQDYVTAKLKKPPGFKGDPLFADYRSIDPDTDFSCTIKQDPDDTTQLTYSLKITDFSRCGVLKRNGFIHVRIWFPQYPGVVMQSDQELIIMCKPPERTVVENKAAGFAGAFPHGARVSGIVEETPGRLEYEVALYKEAPPIARVNGVNTPVGTPKEQPTTSSEVPVDQAVPIGTKLQLRARIGQSAWKYIKLMEVTVSPDPDKPQAGGAVWLVRNGCRNRDFATIIPHQPAKYRDRPNEVFLDFEAFLLSSMGERATLWIHSQIKACVEASDCAPDFCMDLYEPSGHGRRRREVIHQNQSISTAAGNNQEYTRIEENLKYTVIMPSEGSIMDTADNHLNKCRNAVIISVTFTILLLLGCMSLVRTSLDFIKLL
uniref:ZP domain-containing protein n=1 Tax=Glossina brevipalpis TaxID=37001 RepID=A0A1A9WJ38_9MUSC